MRGKAFIEEMLVKPLNAAADAVTEASWKIASGETALHSNGGIISNIGATAKGLGIMGKEGFKAGGKAAGEYMDNRAANVIGARIDNNITPNNWVAKQFENGLVSKNKYVSRGASMFYEGDTGKLATGRIAGVSAGLGLGAYGVLSDDDD
jgi:hypothetical protein